MPYKKPPQVIDSRELVAPNLPLAADHGRGVYVVVYFLQLPRCDVQNNDVAVLGADDGVLAVGRNRQAVRVRAALVIIVVELEQLLICPQIKYFDGVISTILIS